MAKKDFYGRSVNKASIRAEIKVFKQMGKTKLDAKNTLMHNLNLSPKEASAALKDYDNV